MDKKHKHFIKQPTYPKGQKAMDAFIFEHLIYPEDAYEAGVEGVVTLEYDINHLGRVVATRIIKSLHSSCDAEAARLAKLLEFEVERTRGLHVIYHKKLNIRFNKTVYMKMQKSKQNQIETSNVQLTYTYIPSAADTSENAPEKGNGNNYSYTISY